MLVKIILFFIALPFAAFCLIGCIVGALLGMFCNLVTRHERPVYIEDFEEDYLFINEN